MDLGIHHYFRTPTVKLIKMTNGNSMGKVMAIQGKEGENPIFEDMKNEWRCSLSKSDRCCFFHVLPHKVIESWTRMCSHVPLIYFWGYYDNKIPYLRVTV